MDYSENGFIDYAFSKEELTMMPTEGLGISADKVKLLGIADDFVETVKHKRYSEELYTCTASDYARAMGVWSSISDLYRGKCSWWIDKAGKKESYKCCMDYDGNIFARGVIVDSKVIGVRPVVEVVFSEDVLEEIIRQTAIPANVYGEYRLQDLEEFYKGERPNPKGLYFCDIWNMSDEQLEKNHSYIQWLFPVSERSQYNPYAPVISKEQADNLRGSSEVFMRDIIEKSLKVMLNFYGFQMDYYYIDFADDFKEKSKVWLTPRNHNYKRITRMLNSLELFDDTHVVRAFRELLKQVYEQHPDVIGETTARYWGIL